MWCIPKITPEFRKRMYDLLDLYTEPYDPARPVIGADEKSKQLLADKRHALPPKPGRCERYDYEYRRKGMRNIFVAVEPKGGRRVVQDTRRRTKQDFARFVRQLVKRHYARAAVVRLVVDNLNTHGADAFFETFPAEEATALLEKLEFHYTPKHASWLNVAELEINIMDRECLEKRRFADARCLRKELAAWARRRNAAKKKIDWRFTRQDADRKLSKHYIA